MKYTIMPSLVHIALVKIVAMLWMQYDIRYMILNISVPMFFKWQYIEERVITKVPQLPVSDILKKKITNFIKPIGSHILKWIEYHCTDDYLGMDLPNEFCWTPQGTIDRKKTAMVLIKDGNLDIIQRYKLACIYCLNNDIPELWNNIPESQRDTLSFEDTAIIQHFIWLYWTRIMQLGDSEPFYSSQYVVESCAKDGNKAATEYYLEELFPEEKEESLVKAAQETENVEVLCFLLSQMDEHLQKKVFESNPYEVLRCFLDWPMENLFTEVADHIWDFLSERDFDRLLLVIMVSIRDFSKDSNYEKIFKSFWQKSPSTFKSYVIQESYFKFLMPHLIQIKEQDKIKFLLQDVTLAEKNNLIYWENMQVCRDLISNGDWDFLRFLIQECLPSENEMTKFKEDFEKRVVSRPLEDFKENKQKWDQLFFTSDVPVRISSERECSEEVESQPFKKSRCTQ